MKNLYIAIPLLVIFTALGVGLVPRDTAAQQQKTKVKWEYKAIERHQVVDLAPKGSGDKFADGLNKLGSEGWELVSVEPSSPAATSTFFFKRPK